MENITLGQLQTAIIFLATFLTSGGVILALALKIIRTIIHTQITPLCSEMTDQIKKLQEDNKKIHEELLKNSLDTMRIAICSQEVPLKERIEIGERYIASGGNGCVKILVHTLEDTYEESIKCMEKKGVE